jgi:hypothetical protein
VIQDFLADHEQLFARGTVNDTAVVFSVESNFFEVVEEVYLSKKAAGDNGEAGSRATAFQRAAHAIGISGRPFDVVMFHDGRLRDDDASAATLSRYSRVVLPDAHSLTPRQVDAVLGYLEGGGSVTVTGRLGATEPGTRVDDIRTHARTSVADAHDAGALVPGTAQVEIAAPRVATNLQSVSEGRVALHVVNYDYDETADATVVARDVEVAVRLPFETARAVVHAPEREPLEATVTSGRFTIPELGCYAIVELTR